MLKMKKGCTVPFPEKLSEGYEVQENSIVANVGIDKIEKIIHNFIVMHDEPLFFILEIPTNLNNEEITENGNINTLHKDVYYIDGCSKDEALTILNRARDILINDGISSFGFGGHESGDEIMFGKYNVMTIFSHNIAVFGPFLEEHGISRSDDLITAWNTFSPEHPGNSVRYELNGTTVFDIPEMFKEWGIYLAEQREGD